MAPDDTAMEKTAQMIVAVTVGCAGQQIAVLTGRVRRALGSA